MSLPLPYYTDDKHSFAYPTVHERWPKIIKGAIDDVESEINKYSSLKSTGDEILANLRSILDDFKNDATVREFTDSEIKLNPHLSHFNKSLQDYNLIKPVSWQHGPWIFLECYLYQYINNYFISKPEWKQFDIFHNLKTKTFKQSELGVLELCKRYETLSQQIEKANEEDLHLLFKEFIDISLWGNATDLSLLAGNVTLEDIKSVQGAQVRKKNEEKIIVNDLDKAWNELKLGDGVDRYDIVLDNSGFELFADLILSLFLLDSKLTKEIHLHCKEIPWFVSDTMPKDFNDLLKQLKDESFFNEIYQKDREAIQVVASKIESYHKSGQIIIQSDPFWTLDYNYWFIPNFKDLYKNLQNSNLIIFKGDLNYRKLTGDLQWNKTTSFKTAIQDLATTNLPILSLRTCKADVVVGLPQGLNEKLIKEYESMGENGEFWSSSGKWAVISYNKH
ncbi:unnamed protein product [Candida verbasci]|uniref:Sugar phosphate phosphatase n=1 Tax=Candida verbasci TaxID=1227364 RepID=A0A9W4TZ95_9ASCO|nr:unnamed protein product [Candida verbasci]